jgi:hypothetical protein
MRLLLLLGKYAIFAGLGLSDTAGNEVAALLIALGVFVGSASWWFLLSGRISLLRKRLMPPGLQRINWISGVIISRLVWTDGRPSPASRCCGPYNCYDSQYILMI